MKAMFYGGAISSLAGLAMGMGMALPPQAEATGPDAQSVAQLVSPDTAESVSYGSVAEAYPPSYVINAAYMGQPVTELRGEAEVYPVADVSYEEPAIDRVLKNAWNDAPEVKPQEVAAAGDTTTARDAPPAEMRTYASIDAVLNAAQAAPASPSGPLL
jgi:hypothetical protein